MSSKHFDKEEGSLKDPSFLTQTTLTAEEGKLLIIAIFQALHEDGQGSCSPRLQLTVN